MPRTLLGVCLSLLGAAVGAAVGIALTAWVRHQGFYAMVLPGALMGLGGHLASLDRSRARGIALGLVGVVVGLGAEWWLFPWAADQSLGFFLKHLGDQTPVTLGMIALGGFLAFWWGGEPSPWARPSMGRGKPVQVQRGIDGEDA